MTQDEVERGIRLYVGLRKSGLGSGAFRQCQAHLDKWFADHVEEVLTLCARNVGLEDVLPMEQNMVTFPENEAIW